jgi:hypothetical protein
VSNASSYCFPVFHTGKASHDEAVQCLDDGVLRGTLRDIYARAPVLTDVMSNDYRSSTTSSDARVFDLILKSRPAEQLSLPHCHVVEGVNDALRKSSSHCNLIHVGNVAIQYSAEHADEAFEILAWIRLLTDSTPELLDWHLLVDVIGRSEPHPSRMKGPLEGVSFIQATPASLVHEFGHHLHYVLERLDRIGSRQGLSSSGIVNIKTKWRIVHETLKRVGGMQSVVDEALSLIRSLDRNLTRAVRAYQPSTESIMKDWELIPPYTDGERHFHESSKREKIATLSFLVSAHDTLLARSLSIAKGGLETEKVKFADLEDKLGALGLQNFTLIAYPGASSHSSFYGINPTETMSLALEAYKSDVLIAVENDDEITSLGRHLSGRDDLIRCQRRMSHLLQVLFSDVHPTKEDIQRAGRVERAKFQCLVKTDGGDSRSGEDRLSCLRSFP